jgi:hypothetical protein
MYHSDVGYNALKCDVTALPNNAQPSSAIVLLNFNLPKIEIEDNRDTQLKQRLKEIEVFLVKHFTNVKVSYQLSASYWLANRISGARYRWAGSFFARDLQAASISGAVFLDFDPVNFVQNTWKLLDKANIYRSLTVNFLNSAWHFEELISVIVCCQLQVPIDHTFLIQHGLLKGRRNRSTKRIHITLNPFANALPNLSLS